MPRQRRPIMPVAMNVALIADSLGIRRADVYAAIKASELGPVYQRGLRRVILTELVVQWIKSYWRVT